MNIETRLTFKQLRAFVAVYKCGKLRIAAQEIGVTQSAISILIKQIEETLNVKLFDRTTRALVPTSVADDAIGIAERILQDTATLGQNINALTSGERGRVHLATTPSTGMAMLPNMVRKFAKKYNHIKLVIDDCAPNQFLSHILSERVEFGIGTMPAEGGEFDSLAILNDELQLICPLDHPLAKLEQVQWADLENVPLIGLRGDYGMRQLITSVLNELDVEPEIVHEVGFLGSAVWMTAVGLGVTIFPAALAQLYKHEELVIKALVSPIVSRKIAVVTKKGRSLSPASQLFVDMLIADMGEISI